MFILSARSYFVCVGVGDKKAWARDVSSDGKFLLIGLLAPKRLTSRSKTAWKMVKMVLTYLFWQWKRKRWLEVFLGQRWCYVRQIKINLIYVIEQFTKIMCPNSKKTFPRTCSDSIHLKRLIEVQYIQNAYISYCNVGPAQVKLLGRHKQISLYREACITFEGFANWHIVFVHGYTKPCWMNNDREGSVICKCCQFWEGVTYYICKGFISSLSHCLNSSRSWRNTISFESYRRTVWDLWRRWLLCRQKV